jgi:hypothetical protein
MFKSLLIGLTVVSLTATATATIGLAQQTQSQWNQLGSSALSELQAAIVRSIDSGRDVVEVVATRGLITVKLVNGNMNDADAFDRENHAAAIASVVSKEIVGKAEFKRISSLRVEFVKRTGDASKVLDAIEFREDSTGAFKHHKT